MKFYEGHTLQDTDYLRSFFTKERLVLPDKILKKVPELVQANITVKVRYYKDEGSAHIYLYANNRYIACCTISTVEYNCSAVMVANLYTDIHYNEGIGWFLLDLVEQWAKYAGYTLLIGNTAGFDQNNLIPKFKKNGWIESNINYVNTRSNNRNIWLYKIIVEAIEGNDDEEDNDYYEVNTDSNEDEDF